MRALLASLLVLLAVPAAWADPPMKLTVEGNTELVVKSLPCTVTAPPGADLYFWDFGAGVAATAVDNVLTVTAAPVGKSRITVTALTVVVDFETRKTVKKKEAGETYLTVGGVPPAPPPGPTPQPEPDDTAKKIPAADFRVLVVYEDDDATKLSPGINNLIYGKRFREYLDSVTPTGADGRQHTWRIFPVGTDASGDAKEWAEAMKTKTAKLPWLVVFNGRTGAVAYSGALPGKFEDAQATIEPLRGK